MRRLEPEEFARLAARVADERKATQTLILDLRGLSPVTDFFVITSGESRPQVRAIAQHVEKALGEAGAPKPRREGMDGARWILLDYGSMVVHVFHQAEREFYGLEALWEQAPRVAHHH